VRLIGAGLDSIVRHSSAILDDDRSHPVMARRRNPYGDGKAAQRSWCQFGPREPRSIRIVHLMHVE
jgi:hypothetical protein